MVSIPIAPGITLEIVPHPDEVIDVDPEIIRNMTRRLKEDEKCTSK
jgi:aromatic ring-opening dioxygenase LigB subunit